MAPWGLQQHNVQGMVETMFSSYYFEFLLTVYLLVYSSFTEKEKVNMMCFCVGSTGELVDRSDGTGVWIQQYGDASMETGAWGWKHGNGSVGIGVYNGVMETVAS